MIEILLASYNGEKFVDEQIQSILSQSYTDWHLTVCDDCSTDKTFAIIKKYEDKYPDKISAISNSENSGSAAKNFYEMLSRARDANYIMLADQDDMWLKDKIKVTMLAMKKMEEKYGKKTPLLVHSDLMEVDENLELLAPSVFYKQKLRGTELTFSKLLCQNSVTGCTVMVNKALLRYINKVPEKMIMHDWWLALIAVAFGHIGFISTPLIKYRQHANNQEGAKDFRSVKSTIKMAGKKTSIKKSLMLTYEQAAEFNRFYGDRLSSDNKEIIDAYCSFPHKSKLKKYVDIISYGFTKSGFNRKIGYWLYV